ncbi:MAG: hypothetical protein WDO14_12305 [Bacteroidota bacterium]
MTSNIIGAEEDDDEDRAFKARYTDENGNFLWRKLCDDVTSNPNRRVRTFAEVHSEMMERMKKRDEEQRKKDNGSEDAA